MMIILHGNSQLLLVRCFEVVFLQLNSFYGLLCVLDGNSLGQDIYEVYWPYLVMSFGTVSRVSTMQETTLLLYLAQHFATAGDLFMIFYLHG